MFIENFTLIFIMMLMFTFPFLNHPLSMGLNILILTILFAISMSMFAVNSWISYALVLVLLGGLLVIFIYVSLLASNEMFKSKNLFLVSTLMILFLILSSYLFMNLHEFTSNSFNFQTLFHNTEGYEWLSQLYSFDLWMLTTLLILYLLLTLIVVVSITKNDFSSLRSFK